MSAPHDAPRADRHPYEDLAGFVEDLVENGTLRAGMRAPSLRTIALQSKAKAVL